MKQLNHKVKEGGRHDAPPLKHFQWNMKPRVQQNKTAFHTSGNRDVHSGDNGLVCL